MVTYWAKLPVLIAEKSEELSRRRKHVFGQQKNIDKLWFDCLTINLQHVLDLLKFILDFSIGKSIWGIIFYYFLGTPHLGGNLLRLLDSQKSGLWHKAIISWARPVCEQWKWGFEWTFWDSILDLRGVDTHPAMLGNIPNPHCPVFSLLPISSSKIRKFT